MTKNTYNEYSIVLKPESPNLKITIKVKSKDGLDGFKNLLDSGYNNEDSSDLNEVNLEIDLVPGFFYYQLTLIHAMPITIDLYLVNDMVL